MEKKIYVEKENRVEILDIVKAICIMFVIVTHCTWSDNDRKSWLFPFYVDMAVPIFMVISGFTYTLSANKNHILSIFDWFSVTNFKNKFRRIFLPYMLVFFFEVIAISIIASDFDKDWVFMFLTGGIGPGSYYVPVLMQLLMVFPFILIYFRKQPLRCGFLVLFINIHFEIICRVMQFSDQFYRLSFIRYITFILMGVFLFYYREQLRKTCIPIISFILGLIYLLSINYLGYSPVIFSSWENTSIMVAPFAFSIVFFAFTFQKYINFRSKFLKPILYIGKATFHIFMTQQVYFASPLPDKFYRIGGAVEVITSIMICVITGYIFYWMHQKFDKIVY